MNSTELNTDNYLTDEEYEALNRNLHKILPINPRNATLILTAMHTGARASEVLNLQKKDYCSRTKTLFIRGLKNSFDRRLQIPQKLAHLIEQQIIRSTHATRLFPLSYPRMWEIWHEINPTTKKLHALRHTKAMRTLERTKDPSIVMYGLGHRSFTSTQVYITHAISKERACQFVEE